MGEQNQVLKEISTEFKKTETKPIDHKNLSTESLALLLTADRLRQLEADSRRELHELRERQKKVAVLHKFIRTVNAGTTSKGEFDAADIKDFGEMLAATKQLGVELDESKLKYTTEERDRLLENVRMTIEDYNMLNELQLQTISRMTTERYESYQMARSILKPLHDDKLNKARLLHLRN